MDSTKYDVVTIMDKTASLYYQAASRLKLSPTFLPYIDGFEVKLGKHHYYFRGGETPYNIGSSISVANNKFCMNRILYHAGMPVCNASAFDEEEFESASSEELLGGLRFPLVVKPTQDTGVGYDVLCNVQSLEQLKASMKKRFKTHPFVSIEEYHGGLNSYRVLVFFQKVIGVTQRFPAEVQGDGVHTIEELISQQNVIREELQKKVSLGPIKVDEEYNIRFNELGISLKTIPSKGEKVTLCYTCNSTRGGTMKSLGKQICRENARLLAKAAKILNLNIVGFDVLCEDIMIPITKSRGIIVEANYNPDITIHEAPMFGKKIPVSNKILMRLIFKHPIQYIFNLIRNEVDPMYIKAAGVIIAAWILLSFCLS